MKLILYLLLLFCIPLGARSYAQQSTVTADKMNVMYIGINNPLTVIVEKTPCSDVTVHLDGATLQPTGPCKWDCMPSTPGDVEVKVFVKKGGSQTQIGSSKFRVKFIPDPIATVAGKQQT